jgi:hypothetical protein
MATPYMVVNSRQRLLKAEINLQACVEQFTELFYSFYSFCYSFNYISPAPMGLSHDILREHHLRSGVHLRLHGLFP